VYLESDSSGRGGNPLFLLYPNDLMTIVPEEGGREKKKERK